MYNTVQAYSGQNPNMDWGGAQSRPLDMSCCNCQLLAERESVVFKVQLRLTDHTPVEGHTPKTIWVAQIGLDWYERGGDNTKWGGQGRDMDLGKIVGVRVSMVKAHSRKLSEN